MDDSLHLIQKELIDKLKDESSIEINQSNEIALSSEDRDNQSFYTQ